MVLLKESFIKVQDEKILLLAFLKNIPKTSLFSSSISTSYYLLSFKNHKKK